VTRPHAGDAMDRILALLEAEAGGDDFSHRVTWTYLIGVYLAANALRDAYLLVEGPDCAYMKAQYVQGNHDWLSTLTSVSGFHRLANTALHPAMMTDSREGPLRDMLLRLARHDEAGGVLVTSMPMAFITGADYERLCREVRDLTGRQVIHVPGLSLSGDWLDGYQQTLLSLAKQLELPDTERGPRRVAVVGYLLDRNEEDHAANLRELERMCAALDLELVSTWLSGQGFGELSRVAGAGTILSLPYGRRAARTLARRTGARLLELPLPFGPTATEAWMRTLGGAFDRREAAEAFIDGEMSLIAPRLEWVIPFIFQGLSAGYVGDPHLMEGVTDILGLLGAKLPFAVITNRKAHLTAPAAEGTELLTGPRHKAFLRFLLRALRRHEVSLVITNNAGTMLPLETAAVVEFGFPSVFTHALYDRPFLGFRGFMAFTDTLANTLRQAELARAQAGVLEGTTLPR